VISGTGSVRQIGTGKTILTGAHTYTGGTTISGGTLGVNGSICGPLQVQSGGTLQGTGTVCDTTNFAGGTVAPGNSIGTITVAGNYTGVGGTLEIEAILGNDASPTDLLHVTGNTAGPTNVQVINLGGAGAQTVEGIRIVQVDGVSAGAFSLLGDYVFNGDQAVVGGAYAYRLYQGSVSAPGDGDWYLRSNVLATDPVPTPVGDPLLQAGAPLYESYANVLQSFNRLRTMQQRVGNRSWGPGVIETETPDGLVEHNGIWGQIEATRGSFDPATSTAGANYDLNLWKLHAGADGLLMQNEEGSLVGGLSIGFGTVSASVSSPFGAGTINATGYSLGGALTWHGAAGFYVDGQAQATFYTTDIFSRTAGQALVQGNGGFGYGLSIEAGQQLELGSNWSVTPQAQLAYSNVSASFNDAFGAPVTLEQGDSLVGRLGLSVDYEVEEADTRSHLYGIANLYYDFAGDMVTDLAGLDLVQGNDPLRGGMGVGGSYNWDDDKYSIFGEASVVTSLTNLASGHAFNGNVGLRVRW
jgi:fibronectin-binding autotransporter adhesin